MPEAAAAFRTLDQQQTDAIVRAVYLRALGARVELARMAAADGTIERSERELVSQFAAVDIEDLLEQGKNVILDIDWQGARQVRQAAPQALGVFVLPPTRETLRERLLGRGQDSEQVIERRMRDAINEMSHYGEYHFLVFNDDFEQAVAELQAVFVAQRLRREAQEQRHAAALRALLEQGD